MGKQILNALSLLLFMTVLTGLVYPLAVTGLAQAILPFQANGSMAVKDGVPVGSMLIGQSFSSSRYFRGRPSAAGQAGYDGSGSGGSNLGPTNKQMISNITLRVSDLRSETPEFAYFPVPADLVTASGSGLDPDISPAAALLQVNRIAKERGLDADMLQSLVYSQVRPRQLGFLGEPRVNVLALNLALDALEK